MKVAWLLAAGLCAAAGLTTQVQAQTPAAKLISAPLVAPSGIWSGSATHTRTAQAFTGPAPEVAILAKSLGAGRYSDDAYAKNVYDYIRNNIDIEFRFGLGKGGRGALIDQSGTAFDQAELMVELLRAGGVAASYQAGTITVDGVQFARWTGLSRGGAPGAAVDARSACQFLADGGIPASFAGATTCDGLNGDLSSVSMAHVWVSSGGKLYDPAFKQHALFGGIDLNTATSCAASASPRCGAVAASAAMTGAETGVYKGVSYIRTVNEAALGAQMDAFAQATQHAIEGADRFAEVEQVIGGKRVDITYAPTPGAALTVPFQVAATWNGDIPDVYRTTMRIRLGAVDRTFYADEIAGRRLRMTSDTAFLVDDVLAAGSSCSTCVANAALLDVNHPYPANGGAYADEALQFRMVEGEGSAFWTGSYPVSFVHAWGATSAASGQHLAAAQDRDPSGQRYNAAEWSCGGVQPYTYAMILSSCRNDAQPVLANKLLGQGAAADKIVAGVNKAAITRHHDLGIVYARPEAASAISFMSVQSAVSVISSEANASKRLAAFEVAAATWAMLEGSVSQQSDDSDRPLSTAGMFEAFNRQGRRFLNVPSASMASVLSSTTYFPTATPGHPTAEALGKARLQEAANAGYATLWPESGNAEVFFKADAVGYTLLESVKGGAPTNANPVKNILDTLKESDEGAARRKYLSVSPATGELTLKPAPDLVTGRDGFPQSLPFQRTYSSGAAVVERTVSSESSSDGGNNTNTSVSWSYRGPDSSVYSHLGAGWTHNYNVAATYSNDGAKALGSDGALNASGAIAGVMVLSDLLSNPTFERRLTAVFLGNWFSDQLVYNAVLIDGVPSGQFHRLPDKSFNPARGNYAKLVQAGERLPQIDYTPVTLTYTGADGDQIDFDWSYDRISSAQSSLNMAGPTFKANQWRFPDGTIVWFDYDLKDVCNAFSYQQFGCSIMAGYQAYVLKSVRNNYGRSLSFTNELVSPDGSSVLKTYQLKRVTDETGRYVEFTLSNCPAGVKFACGTLAVSDGQKTVARYEYGASSASPDPAVVLASNYKLRRWYTPTNQTDPYQVVIYDGLFHVSAVTDALGRQARYFPGSLLGGERWKRGDLVSPRTDVAEVTTSIFDDGNSLLQTINPLQKTWRYEYDDARRKVREVTPELGQTRWKYDVRSNLIETCVMPKATTNLDRTCARASGDLVTVLEYMEDVNVWACGNLVTCNRPRKQVDPGSFATDYRWNTATGLPTQILQPADVENNRPQVDFSYADYAGAGGGTLKLLSEKIEKVSAQASIKTTYAYDPLNKFVLRSATTDPNGKAITTCFRFDAVGNLTGVTDPRASTCP